MPVQSKHTTTTKTKKYCVRISFSAIIAVLLCLSVIYREQISVYQRHYYLRFFQTVRGRFENRIVDSDDVCLNEKNVSKIQNVFSPFRALQVQTHGPLLRRVERFNTVLDGLRSQCNYSSRGDWKPLAPHGKVKLLWTPKDDFLSDLGNFSSQLLMVMLPWDTTAGYGRNWSSLNDTANLLVQNYYEWTADDPLCTWIETPGTIKMKYDVTYNRTCHRNMNRSAEPQTMNTLVLNAKPLNSAHYWPNGGNAFPADFYTHQPPFAFYVYVVRDAVVTDASDVYSGHMKLVQFGCSNNVDTRPPSNVDRIPLYDEIFPIAQYWGAANFHRMVEILPRVSLCLDFLKRHPTVKILAPETGGRTAELMKILGLNETRLIRGTARAKIAYVPRSSMCGFANVQEIQVISLIYRNYIVANLSPEPRNRLVLIRRSRSRRFTDQVNIEKALQDVATAFNLTYVLFIDNPVPSLNER